MSRLRRIAMVVLLLGGLFHAWGVHDLIFGHHHDELREAFYSTSLSRDGCDRAAGFSIDSAPPGKLFVLVVPTPVRLGFVEIVGSLKASKTFAWPTMWVTRPPPSLFFLS